MPTPGPLELLIMAVFVAPVVIVAIIVHKSAKDPQAPAATVPDELARLAALRDSGTLTAAAFDVQRARLLAEAQAGPGMVCGRCAKPLSPVWKGRCNHCKALYADFPPTPRAPVDGT